MIDRVRERCAERWAAAPRSTRLLVLLLGAHLLLKVALFGQVAHAPRYGDETYYLDGARALSNLVRDLVSFGPLHVDELRRSLVGNGWFMPGNSILVSPLFLVDPDASITAVRAWIGLATTLLLLATVISVRRVLGDLYAIVLVVFTGLMPMWVLFSYGAWGDLVAGLLIVLLLTRLVEVIRRLRTGVGPSARDAVGLGLLSIATVYARSSAALLVVGLAVVLAIVVVTLLRGRARVRGIGSLALAGVVFGALLAPWSLFASAELGSRVVTTTSVPVVLANTFGDRQDVCFGPCDPTSTIWFSPMTYSREVARATGLSELEVQKQMSSYARQDVTPTSYSRDVWLNFVRYTFQPASFTRYLKPPHDFPPVRWAVTGVSDLMWGVLVLGLLAMLVRVVRRPVEAQVLSLLLTLSLGALLTQPFVHISGSRYWTSAAPVAAIALALLVALRETRRGSGRFAAGTWIMEPPSTALTGSAVPEAVIGRWLTVAQRLLAVAVVLVALGLVVLALV